MNDVNKVILVGKIVHKYVISTSRVILTIQTGPKDYPKVFALDNLAEYIINNCPVGSFVRVEGNIQSSKKPKVGIVTTIFADSVKKCSSDMPPENKFFLSGEIVSARSFSGTGVNQVIIKTRIERASTIPVIFYNPHHSLLSLVDDYTMSISGKVQTVKKLYRDGQIKMYHQNYVADFPKADFNE